MGFLLIAIGISAILAALVDTFWAQYAAYVEPDTYLGPQLVPMLLIFTTIGGRGSRWGAAAAPLFLAPLLDTFKAYLASRYTALAWILYGIPVILVILLLPRGVMTWVEERLGKSSLPKVKDAGN